MAGRGPSPKGPSKRARSNKDPVALRVIQVSPTEQPELPAFDVQVDVEGVMTWQQFQWPARTREWWQMWADSPLSDEFTSTDWSELLDCARLHAEYWSGNIKVAPELRLRTAKFGATPEDRARLRIQFAAADEAEDKRGSGTQRRGRHAGLKLAE